MKSEKDKKRIWRKYLAHKRVTGHFAEDGHIHKGNPLACSCCSISYSKYAITTEMPKEEIDAYNEAFDKKKMYERRENPYLWFNGASE